MESLSAPAERRQPSARSRVRRLRGRRTNPLSLLVTLTVVLALPPVLLPGSVTAQSPEMTVSGYSVPGGVLAVAGHSFAPGKSVQLTWDGSSARMPEVRPGNDGRMEIQVQIPASAEPGEHVIGAWSEAPPEVLTEVAVDVLPPAVGDAELAVRSWSPSPPPTPTPTPTPSPTPTPTPIVADDAGSGGTGAANPPTGAGAAPPGSAQNPPPATPVPAPQGGQRRTVFVADAETGNASQWCYVHSAVAVGVVTGPVRSGRYAYRSEVRDGAEIFDTERSEYSNGPGACNKYLYTAGAETWTSFSIYAAADFPTYDHWSLVAQWHEPWGGTPPQQINLENDRWAVVGANSVSPRPRYTVGTIQRGQWQDFVIHHKWSTDAGVGFVEVYLNGWLVLPKTYMRTLENNNPVFFSVGQYRDTSPQSGTGVLFIDDVRIDVLGP